MGRFLHFFIESKLPVSTRLDWAREVERTAASTFPKFSDMKTFIEDRVRTLDLVTPVVEHPLLKEDSQGSLQRNPSTLTIKDQKRKAFSRRSNSSSVNVVTQRSGKAAYRGTCSFCGDSHFIGYCGKFAACTQYQRKAHVVSEKSCFRGVQLARALHGLCRQASHEAASRGPPSKQGRSTFHGCSYSNGRC